MIRLVCPNCMKAVSVPDDVAGKEAPCPECGKPISVPARYNPVVAAPLPASPAGPSATGPDARPLGPVHPESAPMSTVPTDRPPPPPGLVPPAYPSPSTQLEPPLPPPPPPPPVPGGYTHSWTIPISPRVMAWVPAVSLVLILFLTLMSWVGSYVGDNAVYTQSPWRAGFGIDEGKVKRDLKLENLRKKDLTWPDRILDKVPSDRSLMVPYLLVLLLAVAFSWAERMVATLDRTRLPRWAQWVAAIWPYRVPITAGLATVALLLVLVQSANGFGLERAMRQAASEKFAAERKAAEGSPSELASIDLKETEEYARYGMERTTWMDLAIILHVLVVLAMIVRAWLERRGNRPPPRIVFQY